MRSGARSGNRVLPSPGADVGTGLVLARCSSPASTKASTRWRFARRPSFLDAGATATATATTAPLRSSTSAHLRRSNTVGPPGLEPGTDGLKVRSSAIELEALGLRAYGRGPITLRRGQVACPPARRRSPIAAADCVRPKGRYIARSTARKTKERAGSPSGPLLSVFFGSPFCRGPPFTNRRASQPAQSRRARSPKRARPPQDVAWSDVRRSTPRFITRFRQSFSGTPRVSVGRLRFCAVRAGVPVGVAGSFGADSKGGGRRRRGASAGAGPGLPVLPSCTRPGGSRSRDGSDDASREAFAKDRRGALDREGAGCRQRRGGDDPRHWRRTATGTA